MAKYDWRDDPINKVYDEDDFDAGHQRAPLPNPLADLIDLSRTYSEIPDDDDWGFNEYEFNPRNINPIVREKIPDMNPRGRPWGEGKSKVTLAGALPKAVPGFYDEGGVFNEIQAMLNKHKKDKATAEIIDALPSPKDIPVGRIEDLARRTKQKAALRNRYGNYRWSTDFKDSPKSAPKLMSSLAKVRERQMPPDQTEMSSKGKSFYDLVGGLVDNVSDYLPSITGNNLRMPNIISGAGAAELTPKKVTPKIKAATTKAFSGSAAQTNISKTQERLKSRFNINLPPEKLKEFANQVANAETGVYENPTQMLSADPKSSAVGKWQFVNDSRRTAAQGILNRNPNAPDWVKKAAKPMTDKAHTKFMQGLNESQQQDLFYARLAETKGSDALMAAWVKSGYDPRTAAEMYERIHWGGKGRSPSIRRHFLASNKKRYT